MASVFVVFHVGDATNLSRHQTIDKVGQLFGRGLVSEEIG